MPELPEVETIRCGLASHICGHTIQDIIIRQPQLRWPVPNNLPQLLINQNIINIERRAKYLLLKFSHGTLIIHLGMSGSLQLVSQHIPYKKHDHVDIVLDNAHSLRFNDARRFGFILWTDKDPLLHKLLNKLGPEPLSSDFDGDYLYLLSRKRNRAIKLFIMDSHVVSGVGNIYANEVLFAAKINPQTPASKLSNKQYQTLAKHIKLVLKKAIACGGTTFRDFINSSGKPGYFQQELQVYGRGGQPCKSCNKTLKETRLGQRTTVFCPVCQR